MRRLAMTGFIALQVLLLGGCRSLGTSPLEIPAPSAPLGEQTLTLIVAQLRMHLRDDTYRGTRHMTRDGQSVFELALWRLDRLQRERAVPEEEWSNVDIVIEYARARALERLRRYGEAAAAYDRVASTGSLLSGPALEAREVMWRFARHSGVLPEPIETLEDEVRALQQRVEKWRKLAWEYRRTSFEPLAFEEAEAWSMLEVEAVAQHRGIDAAIEMCHRLIERHRDSKLYAKHLIRLGDLYAEAARRQYLRYRAGMDSFDAARYEGDLDRAFAAYELAGEARRPALRAEAAQKIQALLAAHQGVRADVP